MADASRPISRARRPPPLMVPSSGTGSGGGINPVMASDKPHLILVGDIQSSHDEEFLPLPMWGWDERPITVPLDQEECSTAIHLAHGSLPRAAQLLKVSEVRLKRFVKQSPRLQRVLSESFELALDRAAAVPIDTLFDPEADSRRLEWASTKLLQSRLAAGHPLSPAPALSTQASLTVSEPKRSITFRWRTDADDESDAGG
jgi:hypothetical protein